MSLPTGRLLTKLPTVGQNGVVGQFSHWFGAFKRRKGFTGQCGPVMERAAMSQMSFSDAEYAGKRKKTRREVFP